MTTRNERFNLFCSAIVTIVNSHGLTSQIYNYIRDKMGEYLQKIESLTDEVALQQSGSSYDNLHMTRLLQTESGEQIFVPTTDFDYNIIFKKLLLAVNEADVDAGNSETEKRPSTSLYFGVLQSSENPGYAKVRISQYGRQYLRDKQCDYLFEDINSEGFLTNIALKRRSLERLPELTTSGPAFSNFLPIKQGYSYDFVYALPVDGWPDEASEWISRDRPAGWPSEELVSRIVQDGCMVVPVGHYTSDQSAFEWRISFNHSERLLSTSLSRVQRHCYCLTKLLLKTGLPEGCILSSYHMKNVFFYMVESQPQITWESRKLGYLLMELLKEIAQALANHNIPNYFIRKNNMIHHRTKNEVRFTLKEVCKLVEKPFTALAALCQKLQLYEKRKNPSSASSPSQESVELMTCLELYTALNQSLYLLGLDRITDDALLSSSCFSLIRDVNALMIEFPKHGKLFTAKSVPDLLITSALQNVQAGKVNEALSLHKIMYDHASQEDLEKFPQILTNLGCLHNCIAGEMPQDAPEKTRTLKAAQAYFEKALKINGPCHSLHFVYGNFLYSNKLSYHKAVTHFEAALKGRSDDTEIFITVEIPDQEGVRSVTIDSATGSFYFLALCHYDMQDIYSQRKTLRRFAENAHVMPINKRSAALELCAFAHGNGGLSVKGALLIEDAKKAEKAAELLQIDQSLVNMFKQKL